MTDLEPVPATIDGARVLQYADTRRAQPTGNTRHSVGGQRVECFAGLAICTYGEGDGCYLFYCDELWRWVTDTWHESITQAVEQARFEYGPVAFMCRSTD